MGAGSAFEPDFALRNARAEDGCLLCPDGLTGVAPTGEIQRVLGPEDDPGRAVRELVALANRAGGPDNVTCVVAHVAEQKALTSV
ncbi:PP2C family protein-serine/threonine phosphatase [Streptomyces rapamycinicus]|uniref:PPM-type phosphatase domain-containing protein n=2 Tax=Streptomyces rapamycinicus TaxID=1226757 RepID=A0A0A0N7D2_STRRN|nr:hypothetical protein [Streptomyces rapamycinicus]AGP52429.1 hypothetical protein M271_03995 [Streptomyces rapamycinicus NRRL 5491]MBB4779897.1 protein phosphatase [Streptomyces rapamycinicus]RLV75448.1 hypothetical protein D3C57_139520 [Streptomyces rapamycinicus NRRL 5491]UTP28608.1 hypothetical protein LIV37_04145 [Streptomyces rapamycinicus NRRL 5491]